MGPGPGDDVEHAQPSGMAPPRDEAHPATDVFLAYHEGSLSTEQGDQVQEHLATCPEWQRFLRREA